MKTGFGQQGGKCGKRSLLRVRIYYDKEGLT